MRNRPSRPVGRTGSNSRRAASYGAAAEIRQVDSAPVLVAECTFDCAEIAKVRPPQREPDSCRLIWVACDRLTDRLAPRLMRPIISGLGLDDNNGGQSVYLVPPPARQVRFEETTKFPRTASSFMLLASELLFVDRSQQQQTTTLFDAASGCKCKFIRCAPKTGAIVAARGSRRLMLALATTAAPEA